MSKQALDNLAKEQQKMKAQADLSKKSTLKFPVIEIEEKKKKEEAKEEEPKKKTKPDMVDAWTQTDRSDYSIIKSRMMSHQQYANNLAKTNPPVLDNPLKLKAQKNLQQFAARTPTQNLNSLQPSMNQQQFENITSTNLSSQNSVIKQQTRYALPGGPNNSNFNGTHSSEVSKNFRSPQNSHQRNMIDSSVRTTGNIQSNNHNNIFRTANASEQPGSSGPFG